MALSRRDSQRLRAIEERLESDDPAYAARVERYSAEFRGRGADDESRNTEPAPRTGAVALWVLAIAAVLMLFLAALSGPTTSQMSGNDISQRNGSNTNSGNGELP